MAIIPSLPVTLQNGTTADATQVMANFNAIVNSVNANAANAGINTNITQIAGLTVALPPNQGGTGQFVLTPNAVLLGEGTNAVNGAAPGPAGTALVSNGPGHDPSFQVINTVPSGAGMWWPTATAPAGYVEAAGQSTTGMSAAIIAIYGATLPDMRGVFPRGWDHGRGLDPNAPALLAYVADQFKSHSHTITDPGHNHGWGANTSNGTAAGFASSNGGTQFPTSTSTTGITVNNTGGTETAPKYMAWMFIIKT